MIERLQDYFSKSNAYAFAVLFGSVNASNAHENSDVDIGVYFKDDTDYMQTGFDQAQLEALSGKKVDVVVLNALADRDPLLAFEILANHRLLFCASEADYLAFKTRAQLSYLDHAPLILGNKNALEKRIMSGKSGERNYA